MKWRKRGYLLAAILALASATIQAADVTITVNGKVVAKPCTVSTTNATAGQPTVLDIIKTRGPRKTSS